MACTIGDALRLIKIKILNYDLIGMQCQFKDFFYITNQS